MSQQPAESGVTVVAEGKFVRLVRRGKWEYVTRRGISGIVGIVAVTDEGKLLLVEQERPPVGARVIELPAGLAGDVAGAEHEDLAEAARRELLEETGYAARDMIWLAEGAASAGISDEIISLYLATGLTRIGAAEGDGSERLILHEVPLNSVPQWLEERRKAGMVIDLKIFAGLQLAAAYR
jgi:ADP-ribose pyrophosphatase